MRSLAAESSERLVELATLGSSGRGLRTGEGVPGMMRWKKGGVISLTRTRSQRRWLI